MTRSLSSWRLAVRTASGRPVRRAVGCRRYRIFPTTSRGGRDRLGRPTAWLRPARRIVVSTGRRPAARSQSADTPGRRCVGLRRPLAPPARVMPTSALAPTSSSLLPSWVAAQRRARDLLRVSWISHKNRRRSLLLWRSHRSRGSSTAIDRSRYRRHQLSSSSRQRS